ncbi:hypothetical protein [Neorhizobium petrolearium]|uniref:hypothetical protein n=1 Tax=Neorhizobium petrolearium TaxID=515361 RepID=UPI003F189844
MTAAHAEASSWNMNHTPQISGVPRREAKHSFSGIRSLRRWHAAVSGHGSFPSKIICRLIEQY